MPAELTTDADLSGLIRTEFRATPVRELLHHSPQVLLGVSADAATALRALDIETVFDLATSGVFEAATKLVTAASSTASPLYQYGGPTSDLVRVGGAGKTLAELPDSSLDVLESIPQPDAATIQSALDVTTVRDLALYPPYQAALTLLTAVYFPENVSGFDAERPADLVPATGNYPTERVQYTTLLMDQINLLDDDPITDVMGPKFAPLNLGMLALADAGFKRVAIGALLTFSQSWYAQGVTLGQLLHSTSLAPGESTRIAVVDWSRRSRAGETEVISEMDDLSNDTFHNRSINEVTQAVANEAQSGFSQASSNSRSTQEGTSSAGEMSAPFGGLLGGPSGSMGHTSSEATTDTHSDSYSTSSGHRDIGSTMLQNVNDRTHQNAHSSRNRRASVIKEVSQSEHEGVSTRVIANYNHMHALTVQYYEVVQVYRVQVAITKADKVVFIPVQLADFNDENLVRRFQAVLARVALTPGVREAFQNLDVLEISPEPETHFAILGDRLTFFLRDALTTRTSLAGTTALTTLQHVMAPKAVSSAATGPDAVDQAPAAAQETSLTVTPQSLAQTTAVMNQRVQLADALPIVQQVNGYLWSSDQVAKLSGLLNTPLLRAGSNSLFLPTDVTVEAGIVSSGATPIRIAFHTVQGGTVTDVSPESPIALNQVSAIALTGSNAVQDIAAAITLTVNRNGVRFPVQLPAVTIHKGTASETKVVQVRAGGVNTNLTQHLTSNRMYYSQAIFRSLDSTQVAFLLAGYGLQVDGKMTPVAQVVEPMPIRYVGNYLAFKMNTDASSDESWAGWLDYRGIRLGSIKEDIVPLASGGTFGEAILGRSNSAEKLDLTRFWNWKDSPIPLQPSDIAAIQTGSRATAEDVKPGQLSNPIINVATPTTLPDPAGTAAILAAIQNSNMFRDMSGLQATIGLAQAALQATSAGAATAGQQAGTNMNNLLQANTERQRIAAQMITDLAKTAASMSTGGAAGGGGSGISAGSNHSQDGAKINYFDKTRGQSRGTNSAGSPAGSVPPAGGNGRSSGGSPSGGSYSQNPAVLAATWGDSQPPAQMFDKVISNLGPGLGANGQTGGSSGSIGGGVASSTRDSALAIVQDFGRDSSVSPWAHLDRSDVAKRLAELVGDPDSVSQAHLNTCGSAVFLREWGKRDPAGMAKFAADLFNNGQASIGNHLIKPGSDLLGQHYDELVNSLGGDMPKSAEWMMMSSLRDAENSVFDFEGTPGEDVSAITLPNTVAAWLEASGVYSTIRNDTNIWFTKGLDHALALRPDGDTDVIMFINSQMLPKGTVPFLLRFTPNHFIALDSPVTRIGSNQVSYTYWSWGEVQPIITLSIDEFTKNYYGAITATR